MYYTNWTQDRLLARLRAIEHEAELIEVSGIPGEGARHSALMREYDAIEGELDGRAARFQARQDAEWQAKYGQQQAKEMGK